MAIDAMVYSVRFAENGGGELVLVNRPPDGNRGQRVLRFDSCPEDVSALNGRKIWGGSETIMLGEKEIAKRIGYTKIEFVPREQFIEAIRMDK